MSSNGNKNIYKIVCYLAVQRMQALFFHQCGTLRCLGSLWNFDSKSKLKLIQVGGRKIPFVKPPPTRNSKPIPIHFFQSQPAPPSPHSLSCGFPRASGEQGTALAVDSPVQCQAGSVRAPLGGALRNVCGKDEGRQKDEEMEEK